MVGIVGFRENMNNSIRIAWEELSEKIENDFPELFSEYQNEAKYYDYREDYEKKHDLKEATKKVMFRKVYDALKTDINYVKSIMGDNLDRYKADKIAELLIMHS